MHDIGKNIMTTMLRGTGYEVWDLGVDVKAETFLGEVRKNQPQVLALSALLRTTLPEMKRVIAELEKAGIRKGVKVIVGGAPVNANYAQSIGADGYAADASEAVDTLRRLLS